MTCKQSEGLAVGDSFVSGGGTILVKSVFVGDPMNLNTVSFDLHYTAYNGATVDIPGAGMGFEATFEELEVIIRVINMDFWTVKLEICYPLQEKNWILYLIVFILAYMIFKEA